MTAQQQPQYKPGDVANGHRLNEQGKWEPLSDVDNQTYRPWLGSPAVQPKKKHTTRNVLLTLGVLILLAFAGCVALVGGAVNEANKPDTPGSVSQGLGANDATADVVLGQAEVPDAIGVVYLPVTVTNHSEKRSDYYIEIAANDAAGDRVDFGNVLVMGLEPGQSSVEQAMFTNDLPAGTSFKVIQVQRTASV